MKRRENALLNLDVEDDLILESIDTTAKRLGCARSTLYQLINRGEIRTVRVASRQMIPVCERHRFVRDQLERRRHEPRDEHRTAK